MLPTPNGPNSWEESKGEKEIIFSIFEQKNF